MTNTPPLPEYPPGRGLLAGKTVLVTAAAGTGIGSGTGFDADSSAGDLVSSRHSRARVGRRSWRCTTMSIMPWSLRYSAR